MNEAVSSIGPSWALRVRDRGFWQTVLRGVLIGLALLTPLHLPYALPRVQFDTAIGWEFTRLGRPGMLQIQVTSTRWHAVWAGLHTGDLIVSIQGVPATEPAVSEARNNAEPGDTLELTVLRDGRTLDVSVPVAAGSPSYAGYQWYWVALGVAAWLLGFAFAVWRGHRIEDLVLSAAFLLLPAVMFVVELPGSGPLTDSANYVWKLQAGSYRFLFPVLLLYFLVLKARPPGILSSSLLWGGTALAALLTLGIITDGLTRPLLWRMQGPHGAVRSWAGLGAEISALAGLLLVRRKFTRSPAVVRWLSYAVLLLLVAGVPLSVVTLTMGERAGVVEFIRQIKSLTLALVVGAGILYLLASRDEPVDSWGGRRKLSVSVSIVLTALYGFAVAGAAAIVHSALDPSLHAAEWLLLVAIFAAVIVFSPVLLWGRELVDRKMFARWIQLETRAQRLVDRIGAELKPVRIVARLRRDLPLLFGTGSVRLVVASELVQGWDASDMNGIERKPREELTDWLTRGDGAAGAQLVPVHRPDGELIAAIRIETAPRREPLEPPEHAVLRTIAQGVASALRNADVHLTLQGIQQELAEADRISAIGALAGGLAHEVKNPLASLKMGLYLLERDGVELETLKRLQRDVGRIDDLVSSLLRFTLDGPSSVLQPIDVRALVQRCIADLRPIAEDRGIRLVCDLPREPAFALGGESEVRIIISNLVGNAIEVVETDGVVRTELSVSHDNVVLTTSDSGPGIPEELYERIFDLNFSTKPGGSGLGLALARREAERLGGRVEVQSSGADTTALCLVLPRAEAPAHQPEPA